MADVLPPRPLRAQDKLDEFDCGRGSLNGWLVRHAWRNHVEGVSRVNVMVEPSTDRIVGFVTLSAGQIERRFLLKSDQRNRPEAVPVTLLGQLAVDLRCQGRGYASALVMFALRTAVHVSRSVGSFGVITHPLDDGLRQFYSRCGFLALPEAPARTMIVRMVDLERSGFGIEERRQPTNPGIASSASISS